MGFGFSVHRLVFHGQFWWAHSLTDSYYLFIHWMMFLTDRLKLTILEVHANFALETCTKTWRSLPHKSPQWKQNLMINWKEGIGKNIKCFLVESWLYTRMQVIPQAAYQEDLIRNHIFFPFSLFSIYLSVCFYCSASWGTALLALVQVFSTRLTHRHCDYC